MKFDIKYLLLCSNLNKELKKLSLLLFSILFFGCSNDNIPAVSNASLANTVKSFTEKIYFDGPDRETRANFNYENGKLKNIIDTPNGTRGEFSYYGDKIISYSYYINDDIKSTNTFNYSGNNLVEILGGEGKTTFSYNANNVLLSEKVYMYSGEGTNYSLMEQKDFNYYGDNVTSMIYTRNYFGTSNVYKTSYEYDANKNMFQNMNPVIKFIFGFESSFNYSTNNVVKQYSYDAVDSTNKTLSHNYEITYNSLGFPTLIKKFSAATSNLISELTIQYN